MDNEQRIAAQIARGMTRQQACMTLGIPYKPNHLPENYDKGSLRTMAIDTLSSLIRDMQRNPADYKPNEITAACKEALDRTDGRPLQATQQIGKDGQPVDPADNLLTWLATLGNNGLPNKKD